MRLFLIFFLSRMEWCCSHCSSAYNRDLIEQSLLDVVQKRSMSFVLQDLVCTKCHGVSAHMVAIFKLAFFICIYL